MRISGARWIPSRATTGSAFPPSHGRLLTATGTSLEEFARILQRKKPLRTRIPLIGLARADAGFPAGSGWDEVDVPGIADENAYALRITGNSMEPVYRDGDVIVVSPNSQTHVGDRVVVRLKNGEVMAKELRRRTQEKVILASLNPDHAERTELLSDIVWMARFAPEWRGVSVFGDIHIHESAYMHIFPFASASGKA